jgi:peptide/nickel transport system substrate-binding protein
MKKIFQKMILGFLVLSIFVPGMLVSGAAAADKVQSGGTLTYMDMFPTLNPMSWDIEDLNWKNAYDTGFYLEHLLVGDLQKGPRGTKKYSFHPNAWMPPDVVKGELLEKFEIKYNPLRFILHLRKGVYWQEKPGVMKARELVADDVVYSINRQKNSPRASPISFAKKNVDTMETPDKYTLVVNLTEWYADWQSYMGWGYYDGIQAPEQEKAPGGPKRWQNATGTGPYLLTEYKEGHSQIYTKNPNYWDSETIGGKKYKLPLTDKVIMLIMKDEATRVSSLRTGKVDLMMSVNWKHVDSLKKSCPQLQWARRISGVNFSMAMRMDKKPFNDIRVRRAMNLAINRKEMIDSIYGGEAVLHTYPFPPTLPEVYTPLEKLPPSARELFTYNPEKAKKLLAEAGYPNGFNFKAQLDNSDQGTMDLAAMVVAYLAKVGVTCVLEPMDYPSYLSVMTKQNHAEGYFLSSDQASPFFGIRKNFGTGSTWNPSMMSDPYIDKTHEEVKTNPKMTYKEATAEIKKMAVYGLDQAPVIVFPTGYSYAAWWPWVKNYYGEVRVGAHRASPIIARIWIDQELKKKMGY